MYIKLTNGQPEKYSIGKLRRDNPNVSFPKVIPDATLAAYDVYLLASVEYPEVDHTKNVTEGTPALVDGVWTQVWNVADASAEEIAERTELKSTEVRSERNAKLAETDYLALSDNSMSAEMAAYRQALRDITSQEGFPFNVVWPEIPA